MILRDPAYLVHLRSLPCIVTNTLGHDYESVVPMHIGTAGKGIKAPDNWALPILDRFHQNGHGRGEITMLRREIPDRLLRDALRAYAEQFYIREWKETT